VEEHRGFSEEMVEFTSIQKIQPFTDGGGGAKPSPIRFLNPWRVSSHPKNFSQLRSHNINRHNHTISVIMAPGSEEAPATNYKKINRSAYRLSVSSAISKLIQMIRI